MLDRPLREIQRLLRAAKCRLLAIIHSFVRMDLILMQGMTFSVLRALHPLLPFAKVEELRPPEFACQRIRPLAEAGGHLVEV